MDSFETSSHNGHPNAPTGLLIQPFPTRPSSILAANSSLTFTNIRARSSRKPQTETKLSLNRLSLFTFDVVDNVSVSTQPHASIQFASLYFLTFHGRSFCAPSKSVEQFTSSAAISQQLLLANERASKPATQQTNKHHSPERPTHPRPTPRHNESTRTLQHRHTKQTPTLNQNNQPNQIKQCPPPPPAPPTSNAPSPRTSAESTSTCTFPRAAPNSTTSSPTSSHFSTSPTNACD